MRELFKQACKITNYNIILTVPLIIGLKVLDLYSFYSRAHLDSNSKILLASITILFMSAIFCAGWFYMVKGAIDLSKKVFVLDVDRANASLALFKTIPEGIGKYFLSFVGVYLILFFIQIFANLFVFLLGVNIIGVLDEASIQQIMQLASSTSADAGMASFVEQLTPAEIVFFGKWSLLFMLFTSLIMYLLMLWVPEIMYGTLNPLTALFKSIKKLFKNFLNTFCIFAVLWLTGFVLLFIYTFAVINPLFYTIISILMYYFAVYLAITIFLYYDNKYSVEDE